MSGEAVTAGVAAYVATHPGCSKRDAAAATGLCRSKGYARVSEAIAAGLIRAFYAQGYHQLFPAATEAGYRGDPVGWARLLRTVLGLLGGGPDDDCLPDEAAPCGQSYDWHVRHYLAEIRDLAGGVLIELGTPVSDCEHQAIAG